MSTRKPIRTAEYLDDPQRVRQTAEERGVLALLYGLGEYTRLCAADHADPCSRGEFEVAHLFSTARAMLDYAPRSLRRGAIAHEYGEMLRAWGIDPDTLQPLDPAEADGSAAALAALAQVIDDNTERP